MLITTEISYYYFINVPVNVWLEQSLKKMFKKNVLHWYILKRENTYTFFKVNKTKNIT